MNNSQKFSETSLGIYQNEHGETSISVYEGELTQQTTVQCMAEVKAAFPNLPVEFFKVLSQRVKDNGFSDQRLIECVHHVIDNCVYPNPTIAQFISYDKRVRLYTYQEMLQKVNEASGDAGIWDYYEKRKMNGKMYWFKKGEHIYPHSKL